MNARHSTRIALAALAAGALTLGTAACSDDDGDPTDLDNPVDGVDDVVDDIQDTIEDDGTGTGTAP